MPRTARSQGLTMLGLGALGFIAGGLSRGEAPLLFGVGALALLVGLVFLVVAALTRN